MTERRKESMIKAIILPVIVAIITGISASYLTVYVTLAVLETRVSYVESNLISIEAILKVVNKNQTELAKRGEWMTYQDRRMDSVEGSIATIFAQVQNTYSRTDSDKESLNILRAIENHHH